jgi:hypothetical protein
MQFERIKTDLKHEMYELSTISGLIFFILENNLQIYFFI